MFGPRAVGKSTWLKAHFAQARRFDLLHNETYFSLSRDPIAFRSAVLAEPPKRWIVVDEVQRIPGLLNEVHALIEEHGYYFALSGSSARKLKRGQANLLAGRASTRNLFALTQREYGDIAIDDVLRWGCLPAVMTDESAKLDILEAYAGTYLREEIKEEALTRNVDAFARFLGIAALANAQVTNLSAIARDAGVARATVGIYFEILVDTLLGRFLPAWTARARIKEVAHPKFYFFDTGVQRAVAGRLRDTLGDEERGQLLETYVFHELQAHTAYASLGGEWSYWRTSDGVEVDFIWQRGPKRVAIEVKASRRWRPAFDRGLVALEDAKLAPSRRVGVYLGTEAIRRSFGVVLPIAQFLQHLKNGEIL
ncbi:MAG: ATP-binding protein [Clostridia bacterium]|nr:ATP-binding protein [Deltaproteobacteria bacterium]